MGAALGVTDEEWKQVEDKDPGIIGRLSYSAGQGTQKVLDAATKSSPLLPFKMDSRERGSTPTG